MHKYKYTNTQMHKYTNTQIHKYTNTIKPNQTAQLLLQIIYVLLPNTTGCFSNTALVWLNLCHILEINSFFKQFSFFAACVLKINTLLQTFIFQQLVCFQTGVNCVKISCWATQLLARALLIISGWYRVIKRPSKGKPTKGVIYELGLSPDDSKSFQL